MVYSYGDLSRSIGLKVKSNLKAEDESVVNFARASWPDYVLHIWLEKKRAFTEIEPIGCFQNGFVGLRTYGWIEQLLSFLTVTKVTAEVAVNNGQAR